MQHEARSAATGSRSAGWKLRQAELQAQGDSAVSERLGERATITYRRPRARTVPSTARTRRHHVRAGSGPVPDRGASTCHTKDTNIPPNTPQPASGDQPLLTQRSALVLIAALVIAILLGGLTYLQSRNAAAGIAAVIGFGHTLAITNRIIH